MFNFEKKANRQGSAQNIYIFLFDKDTAHNVTTVRSSHKAEMETKPCEGLVSVTLSPGVQSLSVLGGLCL